MNFAFQSPARIVGEVKMESIVFVTSHDLDLLFDQCGRLIVASGIEHEATDRKGRPVVDGAAWQ